MVGKIEENCFIVNAPAGSGKTTFIFNKVFEILSINDSAKILCITYTNRAAEELKSRLSFFSDDRLEVYTIHAFFNSFFDIYFSDSQVIDLYFELYGAEIKDRLDNTVDEKIVAQKERYVEKYGEISFEKIKKNIKKIYYNEMNYNSLYYGGLSHDDLISFSKILTDKFPLLNFKISKIYDYIFIDEYQDTSADVLKMFYNCSRLSNMKLFLLGDKMQQIYKNYDGSFEDELSNFNDSISLKYNYRSTSKIVNVLNNLYNDSKFFQLSKYKEGDECKKPLCIITNNVEKEVNKYDNTYLKLFLLNKEKYKNIGAENLFVELNKIQNYSYNGKYEVSDALNNDYEENKDILFKLLYIVCKINELFNEQNIGEVIQIINMYDKIFDKEKFKINLNSDKTKVKNILDNVHEYLNEENISILKFLNKINIINSEYLENIINNEEYTDVLNVSMKEFVNVKKQFENVTCSTQHGVKGEGHDKILFIAGNSSTPNVKMYDFFGLLSNNVIELSSFERFYYQIKEIIDNLEMSIGIKIADLRASNYPNYEERLLLCANEIVNICSDSSYYSLIQQKVNEYLSKKNVTSAKDLFKIGNIYGVLAAYKIFYVGCSRAKEELVVIVDEDRIKDFKEEFINKLISVGFDIGDSSLID